MANLTRQQLGLSLIEALIIVVIVGLLGAALLSIINPLELRDQAINSQIKSDLDRIEIALEDYYSDKGCYPTPYPSPEPGLPCGGETDEDFRVYLGTIPCSPQTNQAYSYVPPDDNCPGYYRLYAQVPWQDDPAVAEAGCSEGCGRDCAYDYGVSSSNKTLIQCCSGCNAEEESCYHCQEDEKDGTCQCNTAGGDECIPGGDPLPEDCFADSTCGGYVGEEMP